MCCLHGCVATTQLATSDLHLNKFHAVTFKTKEIKVKSNVTLVGYMRIIFDDQKSDVGRILDKVVFSKVTFFYFEKKNVSLFI